MSNWTQIKKRSLLKIRFYLKHSIKLVSKIYQLISEKLGLNKIIGEEKQTLLRRK